MWFWLIALLLAVVGGAVALSGLSDKILGSAPAYAAKSSGAIRIGVVLPFSRSYKVIGDRVVAGLELALNQAGGAFRGRKFEVVKEDSEMKPNVGLTKTRKLVGKDKVDFLVGPVSSAVCVAMRNYADEKKVPMIIPTAGNVELAGGDGKWHPAKAVIADGVLIATSDEVREPVHVRYCHLNIPEGPFLYNAAGLPAATFTSQAN